MRSNWRNSTFNMSQSPIEPLNHSILKPMSKPITISWKKINRKKPKSKLKDLNKDNPSKSKDKSRNSADQFQQLQFLCYQNQKLQQTSMNFQHTKMTKSSVQYCLETKAKLPEGHFNMEFTTWSKKSRQKAE